MWKKIGEPAETVQFLAKAVKLNKSKTAVVKVFTYTNGTPWQRALE